MLLCEPTDCSTPGFPVLHYLTEFAQTHVHWVSDAIQPSHSLSPPSPAFNLSQHQGFFPMSQLFTSGGQSIAHTQHSQVFNPDSPPLFLGITRCHFYHGICVTSSFIPIPTSRPLPHPWRNCLEKRPKNLIEGIVSTILFLLCRLYPLYFSPTLNAHWP